MFYHPNDLLRAEPTYDLQEGPMTKTLQERPLIYMNFENSWRLILFITHVYNTDIDDCNILD